jgi:urease accessory protein
MTYLKRTLATFAAAFPMWAMAHPGHEQQNSFLTGFIHPFTGIDHLDGDRFWCAAVVSG